MHFYQGYRTMRAKIESLIGNLLHIEDLNVEKKTGYYYGIQFDALDNSQKQLLQSVFHYFGKQHRYS